jgi:hypothetical protein
LIPPRSLPVSQEIDEVPAPGLWSLDLSLIAKIPELLPFSEVVISLERFKSCKGAHYFGCFSRLAGKFFTVDWPSPAPGNHFHVRVMVSPYHPLLEKNRYL